MVVGGSRCALAGPDHVCVGVIEWHHVFPKARLKKQFKYGAYRPLDGGSWVPLDRYATNTNVWLEVRSLDEIIADPRNRMWLCSEGAHEPVTNARIYPAIPQSVWDFCRDYGLTAQLENDLARRSAA